MLDDDRVRVVHLTTPNHLHYPQVEAALAACKHVVCEKPLALTSGESSELLHLAEESGLVHCTNYNIRFYALCREARARVRRGDLGEVTASTASTSRTGSEADRLELAARSRPGRALRGRGHRHALARPDELRHRQADHPSSPTCTRCTDAARPDRAGRDACRRSGRRRAGRPGDRVGGHGARPARATRTARGQRRRSRSSRPGGRTASPSSSTAPRARSRGRRSGRRSRGSGIATGRTSLSSTPGAAGRERRGHRDPRPSRGFPDTSSSSPGGLCRRGGTHARTPTSRPRRRARGDRARQAIARSAGEERLGRGGPMKLGFDGGPAGPLARGGGGPRRAA